jgi:hypothetical protein
MKMLDREPLLHPTAIDDLRPTQMTVGYREVSRKRRDWRERADRDGPTYLGQHMIPVVLGPHHQPWMIDNHHLARALHEEGVKQVLVRVVADLSRVKGRLFETFMDNRNWLHPFDAQGRRRAVAKIPDHIGKLTDDPYRSLAGELRRAGGYAKDDTPFSEFLWADFLRRKISVEVVEADFQAAVAQAIDIAHKPKASYLPGWAGPHGGDD